MKEALSIEQGQSLQDKHKLLEWRGSEEKDQCQQIFVWNFSKVWSVQVVGHADFPVNRTFLQIGAGAEQLHQWK